MNTSDNTIDLFGLWWFVFSRRQFRCPNDWLVRLPTERVATHHPPSWTRRLCRNTTPPPRQSKTTWCEEDIRNPVVLFQWEESKWAAQATIFRVAAPAVPPFPVGKASRHLAKLFSHPEAKCKVHDSFERHCQQEQWRSAVCNSTLPSSFSYHQFSNGRIMVISSKLLLTVSASSPLTPILYSILHLTFLVR